MSVTLRRKMFKLGGEVSKTHGVGITSNLNYNKGGKVDPRPPGVMRGPDGKMREAHNPLLAGIVGPGMALLRSGAGLLSKGLGGRLKFLKNLTMMFFHIIHKFSEFQKKIINLTLLFLSQM